MRKRECPYMSECKQFVTKHDFEWKCLGKYSWNHENCFKNELLGREKRELPIMWWAYKITKEIESEKDK